MESQSEKPTIVCIGAAEVEAAVGGEPYLALADSGDVAVIYLNADQAAQLRAEGRVRSRCLDTLRPIMVIVGD